MFLIPTFEPMKKDRSYYDRLRDRVTAVKNQLDVPIAKVFIQKFPQYADKKDKLYNVLNLRQTDPKITLKLEELAKILKP